MTRMIDKSMLLLFGGIFAFQMKEFTVPVVALLTALTMASLNIYFSNKKVISGILLFFLFLCMIEPAFTYFLPLLFYDSCWFGLWWGILGLVPAYLAMIAAFDWKAGAWIVVSLTAVLMAYKTKKLEGLKLDMIRLRDTSTELNLMMTERNKELIEKQDYEIHVATLKERNRIAREIHDNVGHMLSRSILQIGAFTTIYKEEPIHQQLVSINDTLNQAMNSIRESVHDLHDDSIDLRQAIIEATKEIKEKYDLHFEYDMSNQIPMKVKYCFIATVKEAMSNIIKHSNADRIEIIFREHPAFYQLSIEDNGEGTSNHTDTGMGLSNMRERVESLNGTIHIHTEQGFKIFISIRKAEEMK